MREHPFPTPRAERPQAPQNDWLIELRDILFGGTGASEGRLEAFLDRMENRR